MRRILSGLAAFVALITSGIVAQSQPKGVSAPFSEVQLSVDTTPAPFIADAFPGTEAEENKKDPAYKTYKAGYTAILDERWEEAMENFAVVKANYAKSEYLDDAEYWNAYALSHIDRGKAIDAYKKFMKQYPKSSYLDDALADLGNLNQQVTISTSGDSTQVVVVSSGNASTYGVAPTAAMAEKQLKKAQTMLDKHMKSYSFRFDRLRIPPMASFRGYELEKLEPDTKLRLEALEAIAESKDDDKAFQVLKETALDRRQPPVLRNAALGSLADFKKFDVLPICIDLAKNDTSEKIQTSALSCISEWGKDKNKSVEVLANLFTTAPSDQVRKRQTVLFLIADVGNDKAVDFLSTVARTHENYDLRSDAVYYLGTVGGEKARTALYQILRNK